MPPNYICDVGRVLAIDYGKKRCGLAVTDPLKIIASPLDTVEESQLISFLKNYFRQEEVETIVLGIPYDLNGQLSATTEMVLDFKEILSSSFPDKKVVDIDERFTSVMAQRTILHTVKSKKKRRDKGMVDRISAAIILESYLQRIKNDI